MKLFYSATSPFVRKVLACAIAVGLRDAIELVSSDPWSAPPDLAGTNPLSQIPCLVTDDGMSLYDSPVICEYLDFAGQGSLFPPPGPARWRALRQQAVADGILAHSVLRRRSSLLPAEDARTAEDARLRDRVARGLDALAADIPDDRIDIGTVSVACALGYLDFRFAVDGWRTGRAGLAAWAEAIGKHRPLSETA